jgi:hypothetical protein
VTKKHKNTALPDDESEDLRLKVIFKYSLINLIRRLDSKKAVACIGVAREKLGDAKQEFVGAKRSICLGLQAKGRRDEHSGRENSVEDLRISTLNALNIVNCIVIC